MNNTFHWGRAFGYSVLIWALVGIALLILTGLGVQASLTASVAVAVVASVAAFLFGLAVDSRSYYQAFGYGLVWALVGVLLDWTLLHSLDASVFASWEYWLPFAAVLLVPGLSQLARESGREYRFGSP